MVHVCKFDFSWVRPSSFYVDIRQTPVRSPFYHPLKRPFHNDALVHRFIFVDSDNVETKWQDCESAKYLASTFASKQKKMKHTTRSKAGIWLWFLFWREIRIFNAPRMMIYSKTILMLLLGTWRTFNVSNSMSTLCQVCSYLTGWSWMKID